MLLGCDGNRSFLIVRSVVCGLQSYGAQSRTRSPDESWTRC